MRRRPIISAMLRRHVAVVLYSGGVCWEKRHVWLHSVGLQAQLSQHLCWRWINVEAALSWPRANLSINFVQFWPPDATCGISSEATGEAVFVRSSPLERCRSRWLQLPLSSRHTLANLPPWPIAFSAGEVLIDSLSIFLHSFYNDEKCKKAADQRHLWVAI